MADNHTTPNPAGKSSRGGSRLALVLFFLFLYALSPGPVIKLYGNRPPPALHVVYAPLRFLYKNVPPLHDFYDWYSAIWRINL
jgi:hypothetical protein